MFLDQPSWSSYPVFATLTNQKLCSTQWWLGGSDNYDPDP